MIPLDDLEQLAIGIAQGEPVNWNGFPEGQAAPPEVVALRLIAAIAAAHAEDVPPRYR